MKVGTPGFVAARLTEGREVRGMTQTDLAQAIGVTRQSVSLYESGDASPQPAVMDKIRATLGLPNSFFFRTPLPDSPDAVFFRSNKGESKRERIKAARRQGWAREITHHLAKWVDFPSVNLPALDLPRDVTRIRREDVDRAVAATRAHWRLGEGPIANIVAVLESAGVVVVRDTLEADGLDALSRWPDCDPRPCFVLGEDKATAVRSRFDAAHELGHMLLHRGLGMTVAQSIEHFDRIERQCHYFAGSLLLPERAFIDDVFTPTLDSFRAIKPRWGVSIAAMTRRARDVGMIDDDGYKKMVVACSRRGWRKGEPLDDELPIERPRMLRDAVEMVVNSGVGRAQLLDELALPQSDVEAMAGLPGGYLNVVAAPVVVLRPRAEMLGARTTPQQTATVLPFQRRQTPRN